MQKTAEIKKERDMIIDGCTYPLYHGGRLTFATPKMISETLKKLDAVKDTA